MKVTKKFAAIALAFVLLTGVCVVPASAGAAPAPFYLGDKNGDGIVGISDFVLLLRALFGIAPLQSDSALRADVDADGTTGFKDAFLILLTALKMIPPAEYNAGGGETEEFVMGSHDLVVSPLGSDLWSGKIPEPNAEGTDGPLASIEEAKERLKKLKNIDCGEGSDCILKDVTVWLREGAYFPAATLKFGPDDLGNVTYKAYPGEKPAISGAVPVSGWRAETVNGVPAWTTQLEPGTAFNTLYRGGTSLPRPRFPKEGELNVASVNHADELAPDSTYFKANLSFNANPADMFAFHNLKDVDVRILHFWKDELIPLESFDPATGYVRLSKPSSMTISEGDRYFFENVFEALDEPGEWYLDQVTGKLAYVPEPSEDIASTVLYAGKLERIMSIDSVDGIVFEGITFRDSEWNIVPQPLENSQAAYGVAPCILVQNAENIAFTSCRLENIGASGIKIGADCQNCSVTGSLFYKIGANAVFIEGQNLQPGDARVTRNIKVSDNHIYRYGRNFNNAIGVLLIHARECEISHNEIHDGFYTGISAGWVWGYGYNVTDYLKISDNLIYDIGQGWLADMGGIYTLGMQPHTVVSGNVVHDVGCYSGSSGYGGWGIYLDEGSTGITVENNLAYDCSSQGFHQHYGRENLVRNNIFAFNADGQVRVSRVEEHTSLFLKNNIIVSKNQPIYTGITKGQFVDDSNLYWDYCRGAIVLSGSTTNIFDRIYPITARCRGYYNHGVFEDPRFVDACARDFRLKRGSPAFEAGFVEWDISAAGTLTAFDVG
ncbi:MAG TPA: right-handed parallel beta-helix repeat-containing protein [Clostridiales bacterium]|nr:MAG: hypothetical protein BWY37_01643 [Firmicutes bacterium ADurb.Bin262]HOU10441.1 right-handed parallel beta-helix repeat-containing protein [Clostridiales bacterium]HQK74158.1 right-handed parallel beta-helix repeat-containing protein [Clostridiales bacterium]